MSCSLLLHRQITGSNLFIPKSQKLFLRLLQRGYSSTSIDASAVFGFGRAEVGRSPLAGTVAGYNRHLFLRCSSPGVWPSRVDSAEWDPLPGLLSAALKSRTEHLTKRTRLTICEGEDGTESSNGDVLIFPEMTRYRH
ncbi:altered inheritance of mitochondria protein 32 [Iris pallida]|uniref:Altered inheritance of mitochondria protein 32 n=1 Tax=Iris pallida TaxID=29817 RepID=A0AAX6FDG3_IRIPA|nr:altered inheritance of mitochondria protein 32 [Iris pallida]